jgi:hypothetical protein
MQLALRVWISYLYVLMRVRREPLPELVSRLGRQGQFSGRRYSPVQLSRATARALRVGQRRPTCLVSSLVLYRLLRMQGEEAELVIGLPLRATDKDAHAWVELDGRDTGPPPGRGQHVPLARFGAPPGRAG